MTSQSIARQVAEYRCYTLAMNAKKEEDESTCPATRNAIFSSRDKFRRGGVIRAISSSTCFATALRCKLQEKLPRVTGP